MQIDLRRQFLSKLDDRDLSQEKNLKDLVLHAKKITNELEKYKQKVEFSENIVKDLQSSGNESVDSLLGMLKKYKRQQRNTQDEIEKLNQLILMKDAEIIAVTEEVKSLKDFKANMHETGQRKVHEANLKIEENKAVIKRQDKLIVDLHQKNQVCEYKIIETQEEKNKQERAKNQLELRMQELEDRRKNMTENISTIENRLTLYRNHLITKEQEARQRR